MIKEFIKNWEKILLAALICALGVIVFLLGSKNVDNPALKNRSPSASGKGNAVSQKEKTLGNGQRILLEKMKASALRDILFKEERNIFAPFELKSVAVSSSGAVLSENPRLELSEIGFKPLEVEYLGRIIFDNGDIIAQVNIHKKSYLCRAGSDMAQYKVSRLNEKSVVLIDSQGREITIEYRKKAFSSELMAKIEELNSQQTFIVNKDSDFLGFKVLDIDGDSVLLSHQGQHLRLEKGMVHK